MSEREKSNDLNGPASTVPQLQFPHTPQVPPWIHGLVGLFADRLTDISFPDVDARRLEHLLTTVDERTVAVAKARAELEAAERGLRECFDALETSAHRAHGYATVFASGDLELQSALRELSPPAASEAKPKKRRKAPRKPKAAPPRAGVVGTAA